MPTRPDMPKKIEIVYYFKDDSSEVFETDSPTAIEIPGDEVTYDFGTGLFDREPQKFVVEGYDWTVTRKEAPEVPTKQARHLAKGDKVKGYGKVREVGRTTFVNGKACIGVAFEGEAPPAVFKVDELVKTTPPATRLQDPTDSSGDLVVEQSNRGDGLVFLWIDKTNYGSAHVKRNQLIQALEKLA